jgi:integrase
MLQKFLRQVKIKNRSERTIEMLEAILYDAQKNIGKKLEEANFEDILNYIESLKDKLSDNTISLYKQKLLQFYRFCFEETEDIKYNKIVKKLKSISSKIEKRNINTSNLYLPEDIKRLINVATLERDRCIIATFWESGMRIGELMALTNKMVIMNEQTQEVTFNIPDVQGCKTGGRTVVCLEIYGYVQDWLKCNISDMFIPISISGVSKAVRILFNKAGINKPSNVHMFRHSAITHAVNIGMQQNAISERFWGSANSNMLSTYIHLSEQMQANAYRNAKGMNCDETKVINPIACRCVTCGRLIQSGNLCVSCKENADLKLKVNNMENKMDTLYDLLFTNKEDNVPKITGMNVDDVKSLFSKNKDKKVKLE